MNRSRSVWAKGKPKGEKLYEFKSGIPRLFLALEMNSDLKAQLRELNITAAKETQVGGGCKAIIISVPVPQLQSFQKIQAWLVHELEKKFGWETNCLYWSEENSA